MIKAVIFDMDGILIDSVETGLRVRKKVLGRYGVDLETVPDPQGEGHRAASAKKLLAAVKDHSGIHIDHDEFTKLTTRRMNEELQALYGSAASAGLVAFLKELQAHNIICAIASSSLREGVENKLRILGIKHFFQVVVTGSDVQEHKPHPEGYLLAIKKLGLSPEECIIFEDSLTGMQAAHAAGCRVVGFTQYNPPKEPLSNVILTVQSWDDMHYDLLQSVDGGS